MIEIGVEIGIEIEMGMEMEMEREMGRERERGERGERERGKKTSYNDDDNSNKYLIVNLILVFIS